MSVHVDLELPRDGRYVATMRRVSAHVLADLGAPRTAIDDVQLALAEACANVVLHGEPAAWYQVCMHVHENGCEIEVADGGRGFPASTPAVTAAAGDADVAAESGRGLDLMRHVMDDLQLLSSPGGTSVRLEKRWNHVS